MINKAQIFRRSRGERGVSLVSVLVSIAVTAILLPSVWSFIVNLMDYSRSLSARSTADGEILVLKKAITNQFKNHRTDEPLAPIPAGCTKPKPLFNYVRKAGAADCNMTAMFHASPESIPYTSLDYPNLVNANSLVIESRSEAGTITRIEYQSVCSEMAQSGHKLKSLGYDWAPALQVMDKESVVGANPVRESCRVIGAGECDLASGRFYGILVKQWRNNWNDADDLNTGNVAGFQAQCLPTGLLEYDAVTDNCKPRATITDLSVLSSLGMSMCTWTPNIFTGTSLGGRIWSFYRGAPKRPRVVSDVFSVNLPSLGNVEFLNPN